MCVVLYSVQMHRFYLTSPHRMLIHSFIHSFTERSKLIKLPQINRLRAVIKTFYQVEPEVTTKAITAFV